MASALASGTNPDVMEMGNTRLPPYVAMGALASLEPFLKSSPLAREITQAQWEVSGGLHDGQRYAVPFIQATRPLFYNRAIFREAGLDPDVSPSTWEQWLEAASKTHNPRRGISGLSIGGNDNIPLPFLWFGPLLWQAGGQVLTPDNRKAAFNSKEGVEALSFLVELVEYAQPGFLGMRNADADQLFYQGRAATTTMPSNSLIRIPAQYPKLDFGIGLTQRKQKATSAGMDSLVMFSTAKDKQAAWKVIEWLTGARAQAAIAKVSGFTPVLESLVTSPEFAGDKRWSVVFETMQYMRALPMLPVWARIQPRMGEEIHYALAGKKTPQEALDAAAEFANAQLETAGK